MYFIYQLVEQLSQRLFTLKESALSNVQRCYSYCAYTLFYRFLAIVKPYFKKLMYLRFYETSALIVHQTPLSRASEIIHILPEVLNYIEKFQLYQKITIKLLELCIGCALIRDYLYSPHQKKSKAIRDFFSVIFRSRF